MSRIAVLCVVLLSAGCSTSQLSWDKTDKAYAAALWGCQIADEATTRDKLSQEGYYEANPLLGGDSSSRVAIKGLVALGATGIAHLSTSHTSRRFVLGAGAAVGCGAAAWNLSQ